MKKVRFSNNFMDIRQYEFPTSSIRENPIIYADQINEVNLNTYPPSMVINHREVIFIEEKYQAEFMDFVKRNELKISNRLDIWEVINRVFLDVELSEEDIEQDLQKLEENGIPRDEAKDIQQKVQGVMTGWAAVAWEWNYLGHYDLLLNKKQSFLLFLPTDFYWWTMEIALRNYQSSTLPKSI